LSSQSSSPWQPVYRKPALSNIANIVTIRRQEKEQVQKDKEKELDIALSKPGRAEKGEKPKNRRIIKITTGNICTDSAPNSNIMRTPPRFVDIFWEEKHTVRLRYSRKPLYYSG
jgi:hypothetical protein